MQPTKPKPYPLSTTTTTIAPGIIDLYILILFNSHYSKFENAFA